MSSIWGQALRLIGPLAAAAALAAGPANSAVRVHAARDKEYTDEFRLQDCEFSSTGANPYFILRPGAQHVYEGTEAGKRKRLTITVTNQTRQVAGVETRVVEEREAENGQVIEVSRNYFAICKPTNSVVYYGEEVDIYENGQVVSHDGSWQAGSDSARPGLMMPGTVLLGARYYQEVAPGVALDRAEIVSMDETVRTPAGTFRPALRILETTPLEPNARGYKYYAAGVGLVRDGVLKLVSYTPGN